MRDAAPTGGVIAIRKNEKRTDVRNENVTAINAAPMKIWPYRSPIQSRLEETKRSDERTLFLNALYASTLVPSSFFDWAYPTRTKSPGAKK
jgi:hypothetical protein